MPRIVSISNINYQLTKKIAERSQGQLAHINLPRKKKRHRPEISHNTGCFNSPGAGVDGFRAKKQVDGQNASGNLEIPCSVLIGFLPFGGINILLYIYIYVYI